MQKISVIVPTMWRANDFFSKMIPFVVNSPVVCELIIIDNDSKLRPNDIDFSSEKIKFFDFGENLFFNKSMNIGVEESTGDIVCLLNDDVIFDPAIFSAISQNFDKETMGMIFPHPAYFNRGKENLELIQKLALVECEKPLDGFGCCMFIHKDNFEMIPQEFVHHFGDVFLYEIMKLKNKKSYFLHNWVVITPMRVTTAVVPEAHEKSLNDWAIASEVLARYGISYQSNDTPVFSSGNLPIRN